MQPMKFMTSMKQMTNSSFKKAIILLSGGLDCVCALSKIVKNYNYILALTFDYGQKAFKKEAFAAQKICEFYNIQHKIIKLDWLKNITETSLVSDKKIPENIDLQAEVATIESAKNVWVPNRNSVFINIAAAFLDAKDGGDIIIGANCEEAQTFSDNSKKFINAINKSLRFSCRKNVEVIAPLIDLNKAEIADLALKNSAPLELINSCYEDVEGHCGKCESCLRLKRALATNNCRKYIGILP